MTHNNNQRRFSLKTQARKGTAALLSIALIAALTGCESLSYMGNAVQTAGGYAFDKAEAGYRVRQRPLAVCVPRILLRRETRRSP